MRKFMKPSLKMKLKIWWWEMMFGMGRDVGAHPLDVFCLDGQKHEFRYVGIGCAVKECCRDGCTYSDC